MQPVILECIWILITNAYSVQMVVFLVIVLAIALVVFHCLHQLAIYVILHVLLDSTETQLMYAKVVQIIVKYVLMAHNVQAVMEVIHFSQINYVIIFVMDLNTEIWLLMTVIHALPIVLLVIVLQFALFAKQGTPYRLISFVI